MPRRKSLAPRMNLQCEVPPTLIAALDLIAQNARGGEGVTRSHLIRSVLTEYVELKLGSDFRAALVAHERFGGDVLQEFVRAAVRASSTIVPSVDVLPDSARYQTLPPGELYPDPAHEASLSDADPATVAPVVDAEQYKADNPLAPLPRHFPAAPSKWKGFV